MLEPTLCSFDVFDTVVSRTYATPDDLLLEVGDALCLLGLVPTAEMFLAERRLAELTAWERVRYRQAVTIEVIYDALAGRCRWSDRDRQRALAAEIDLETSSARVVPQVAAAIERQRRLGRAICFVSDMHLRTEHLRAILESRGVCRRVDKVYVSSDCGATKRYRGALFRRVLREHRLPGWRVAHTGDDRRADLLMPRAHLLRARHFTGAHLTAAEQLLLRRLPPGQRALRKLVVASKFARLRELAASAASPATATLCDTVAPFVAGYALWLLARARRDGVSKLFFLARDMQVVCKVAALLARRLGTDVECVYLHASRAAWQPAAFDGPGDLFWLTDQLRPRTAFHALARILDGQEMAALEHGGLGVSREPSKDLDRELRRLLAMPACRRAVETAVERRRDLLLDYLAQRGFSAGGPCALVDAGWRGSLQRTLSRALAHAARPSRVAGYYIGLRHAGAAQVDCPMQPFLDRALVESLGYSLVAVTEAFLTADHGTTLGYERGSDGGVTPTTGEPPPPAVLRQTAAVESACLTYVEELLASVDVEGHLDSLPGILAGPFTQLCADPRNADAAALRRWTFDAGREHARLVPIANPVGMRDVCKIVWASIRGRPEADLYLSGPWVRGSLALTNPVLRLLLAATLRRPVFAEP